MEVTTKGDGNDLEYEFSSQDDGEFSSENEAAPAKPSTKVDLAHFTCKNKNSLITRAKKRPSQG